MHATYICIWTFVVIPRKSVGTNVRHLTFLCGTFGISYMSNSTLWHRFLNSNIDELCTELLSLIDFNILLRSTCHTALFHTLSYNTNATASSPNNCALRAFNKINLSSNIDIISDYAQIQKSIMLMILTAQYINTSIHFYIITSHTRKHIHTCIHFMSPGNYKLLQITYYKETYHRNPIYNRYKTFVNCILL